MPFNMKKGVIWLQANLGLLVSFAFIFCLSNPSCNYTSQACGSLKIPYPFGIESRGCGQLGYNISCKRNESYGDGDLAFLQIGTPSTPELQVLSFSTNTIIINSTELKATRQPPPKGCEMLYGYRSAARLELHRDGPFILSPNNWFVVIGCNASGSCNTSTTMDIDDASNMISCSTGCYNQWDMTFCNGYTCCTSPVPPGSFSLEFQGSGSCGFSTVLSPPTYQVPPRQLGQFGHGHYGLNISWALKINQNCTIAKQHPDYECIDTAIAECIDNQYNDYNAHLFHSYTCRCALGYTGDGYKSGIGCKDIDECEEHQDTCEKPPLGICTNTDGSYNCSCKYGGGSGELGTCSSSKTNILLPVLLGGFAGAASLAVVFAFTCISRRAYRKRRERAENFRRIGGDQLNSFLFSEKELMKATNGFADDHVLGEGGFGKVYWGKVTTQRGDTKVAIKRAKPKAAEEQIAQMQSFVREILLLSKTIHKNVVQLLGCCVETSVPLLVYECVENGTLRDYLTQNKGRVLVLEKKTTGSEWSLWAWRLHIAVQTAEALKYLHTMSEPIFHLDMKSANILIDREYNPKVADFGLSCFLTSDATHLTNQLPAGTFGYVDPEYYHSLRITDKCDVYSFGVILLELISSWPASQGPGAVLAHHFRTVVDMRHEIVQQLRELPSFIDMRLGNDADVMASILDVAELANRCVGLKGSDRPSMQEVAGELKKIQAKNAGKLTFKGSIHDSPYAYAPFGANRKESDEAPLIDYNWIPSCESASTSSLSASTRIFSEHTPASTSSKSAIIQLQQYL